MSFAASNGPGASAPGSRATLRLRTRLRVPCHIWLPRPPSVALVAGEKLPSVQKFYDEAALCLSSEQEELSMKFWPTYRLPEQR